MKSGDSITIGTNTNMENVSHIAEDFRLTIQDEQRIGQYYYKLTTFFIQTEYDRG